MATDHVPGIYIGALAAVARFWQSQSAAFGDETPFFWLRASGAAKGPAV